MGGKILVVHSKCYLVPEAKAWLIIPKRLFNKSKGVEGHFHIEEGCAFLHYEGIGSLRIDYDDRSHLPIALGKVILLGGATQTNLAILNDSNQNLTPAQKVLLL